MNTTQLTANTLSARELILALTDSSREEILLASYFIAAGQLFEMDAGAIRVALARLVKEAALQPAGRGRYQRRNRGGELHSMVRGWAEVEQGLKDWNGHWLGAGISHLGRTNSTRVRARERALRLLGFAALNPGLWIRPANLTASVSQVHSRLAQLGLEADAILMHLSELVPAQSLTGLWSVTELETRYQQNLELLATSESRLQTMNDRQAARETLLIGRKVTRDILLDPLLPAQLLDTGLRRQMISAMKAYDRIGKSLWRAFYQQHR